MRLGQTPRCQFGSASDSSGLLSEMKILQQPLLDAYLPAMKKNATMVSGVANQTHEPKQMWAVVDGATYC